jgi:hypothetical protein
VAGGIFIATVVILGVAYLLFCIYLAIDMLMHMGARIQQYIPYVEKLFRLHGDSEEDRRNILDNQEADDL